MTGAVSGNAIWRAKERRDEAGQAFFEVGTVDGSHHVMVQDRRGNPVRWFSRNETSAVRLAARLNLVAAEAISEVEGRGLDGSDTEEGS